MKGIFLFLIFVFLHVYILAQLLVVYPSPGPNFNKASDRYIVNVSQNGVTKTSFVYKSTAGNGIQREWGREQNNVFNFTTFSFSGTVIVEVTKLSSTASSAVIRPNRLGIGTVQAVLVNGGKKIRFKLSGPGKISVEFNDDADYKDALMIFANKLENSADVPGNSTNVYYPRDANALKSIPGDKKVVYFKAGMYDIGSWDIPASITQVYIAGGAYLTGYLKRVGQGTIKINGRGILSNTGYAYHYPVSSSNNDNDDKKWYYPILIKGGQNHLIEGITIIEASAYNIYLTADNTVIQNVNINGFRYNNDGVSVHGSGNKIIDCFIRVNDDAIVLYSSNFILKNCVFWQLQGSVIQLGWKSHSMENITVSDCDVIHDKASNSEGNVGFINAMNYDKSIQMAIIKNLRVNNIFFDTPILRFLDIRGDRGSSIRGFDSAGQLPWVYEGFHFTNIHFNQQGYKYPLIYLHGYDDSVPLTNFTFENIFFNGKKVEQEQLHDSTFINIKRVKSVQIN